MSNPLAISTVSAAFLRRILSAANAAVPNAKVRLGAPTAKLAEDAAPLVNLHLYRVEPNAAHANDHLPTRGATGQMRGPSKLALNLHYVMSFYGNHDAFEPDLMLGEVMLALEHEPLLSKTTIHNAIEDNDELEDSDLEAALARLRVTRQLMTIDDFSKIWSIFYQVPYALSLSYEVSHVVIETSATPPVPTPVAHPGLWVSPVSTLRLDAAGRAPGSIIPPVWGGILHVAGRGLAKPGLELEVDGGGLAMSGVRQSEAALAVTLDAPTFGGVELAVGVHKLQAIAPRTSADQPDHVRARSNALAFALSPAIVVGTITAPAGGTTATGTVDIGFTPSIRSDQAVRLLLDVRNPAAPAQVILAGRIPVEGGANAASLTFSFVSLPRGDYLVRADVDGLLSPVTLDSTAGSSTYGQIIGPELSL
ncbi:MULTISPECIES: DUF4255 domain-containing protein [Ensifer]|uniref:DUF4255 domain-containing protein n=1 Tax=Ensifer TaxID=106591 RepID=UPI000714158B|nr:MULTISPECIES: DUF4255 domain-containing protein [Ensifer]KQX25806.1 hypothetical protein ASD01_25235 [Ensifer sp. Root423]KQX54799.1 hypothetical protein ASD49_27935 [Ensifer sp. Root1298]KQX89173.1 hypothetical protein ASD41_26615 [Ensifer sp. Root1312]KRC24984.1 hypothetical protein ASE29_25435 [Ensifer sp. Root74]KRD78306.1 hypothetical protein ASE71_15490 [Ensifer sp. Root954]